jgi:catechol 2,3-dioxygenase-like lactoylglutathione lyase family enzyme
LCAACGKAPWPPPELVALLAVVDSGAHTGEESIGERGRAVARFRELVRAGGPVLAAEAARRVGARDPRQRRHAQLILAVAGDAPPVDDPLYRVLRERGMQDPERLWRRDLAGPAPREPLEAAAPAILERLLPARDPVAPDVKEEYARDSRSSLKPQLLDLARRVPDADRWLVDVDGDGVEECFVAVREPLKTHWIHDFRCVALLRRAKAGWSLAGFRRFGDNEFIRRVVIADFDGDGRAEIAVWSQLSLGYIYGHLTMVCAAAPDGVQLEIAAYRPSTDIRVVRPNGGKPLFAVFNHHLPVDGPKVIEAVGVIAYRCDLYAWAGTKFEAAPSYWLPLEAEG